jgi:hypothetical protein
MSMAFGKLLFHLNKKGADMHNKTKKSLRYNRNSFREREKAVRKEQWKLVITKSDTALYNLEHDLKETTDLSGNHKNVVEDLINQLEAWERDVGRSTDMKML